MLWDAIQGVGRVSLSVAALACVAGCAAEGGGIYAPPPSASASPLATAYTVMVDPAFLPEWQAVAVAAVDQWAAAVPVTLAVTIASCSGLAPGVICLRSVSPAQLIAAGGTEALGHTSTQNGGAEIVISTDAIASWSDQNRAPWAPQLIIAHELGHAMGLEHAPGIHALMDPAASGSSQGPITCADVTQWRTLRGLATSCE